MISATDIKAATQGSVCALLSFEVTTVEVAGGGLEHGEKPSKDSEAWMDSEEDSWG